MKLSKTLITGGRYYRAGQEVPAERVPPEIARYAVTEPGPKEQKAPGPCAQGPHKPAKRWFADNQKAIGDKASASEAMP